VYTQIDIGKRSEAITSTHLTSEATNQDGRWPQDEPSEARSAPPATKREPPERTRNVG
jgi:hypothetical protein